MTMKKLNLLYALLFLALLGFTTSCSEDEETDLFTITGVPADMTAKVGDTLSAEIAVVSEEKLEEIEIRKGTETLETITEFDNPESHVYNMTYIVVAEDAGKTIEFAIIVTDSKDNSEEAGFTVTVDAAGDPISSFTAVLLGAQGSSTGSFLDASEGDVYTQTDANTNSALIDLLYYFGSSNEATLTAPDDVTVNGGTNNLTLATGLTTQNSTKFNSNPGVTAAEFIAAENDAMIAGLTDITESKVTMLQEGDVISFETADGKKGLIHVESIATGSDGSITINVKIQE